jgi:phenylacetate-CoA ligase
MGLGEKVYRKSPIALQVGLLNLKALDLYLERYGRKFWKLFEEFERNQWLPPSDIAAYQDERLREIIAYAYEHVPYYRRVMTARKLAPMDIKSSGDLHKLPVLTKQDIKRNYDELISREHKGRRLRHGHTSGTTGSPLDVCYDIKTCVVHHVADWRQKYWAGLKYGEPYASMQGRVIVPTAQTRPPFWRKNYVNNQLFLSSFHLKDRNIGYYFDKLAQDQIRYLEGYPSVIYVLALYLSKHNQRFPMGAVLTSSETLLPIQRELIEDKFQCKVFDFYGMAERAVFATECDRHEGHHLNADYGITEFLDSDGSPVPAGAIGRIVATSIHNHAMPLIRYQTNDCCALKVEPCSCARVFSLMDDVATKEEAIVTLPDGRLMSPSVLTHPFKPMKNIIESQIVQTDLDRLLVRIVRGDSYCKEDEISLLGAFGERLGHDVRVEIEYVKHIERTPNGKLKWVVSNITPRV